MLPHPGCQSGAKPALRRLDTQKKPVVAFHPLQSEPKRFAFSLVIHFPGLMPARENGWTIEPRRHRRGEQGDSFAIAAFEFGSFQDRA